MADPMTAAEVQPEAATLEVSEFSSLLQREFKPKSDQAKDAVESAVRTLAEQALSNTAVISHDVLKSIEAMIAAIDRKLTEQVNLILHHPCLLYTSSAGGSKKARSGAMRSGGGSVAMALAGGSSERPRLS